MKYNVERTLLIYISTMAFGQQIIRTSKSAMLKSQEKLYQIANNTKQFIQMADKLLTTQDKKRYSKCSVI